MHAYDLYIITPAVYTWYTHRTREIKIRYLGTLSYTRTQCECTYVRRTLHSCDHSGRARFFVEINLYLLSLCTFMYCTVGQQRHCMQPLQVSFHGGQCTSTRESITCSSCSRRRRLGGMARRSLVRQESSGQNSELEGRAGKDECRLWRWRIRWALRRVTGQQHHAGWLEAVIV